MSIFRLLYRSDSELTGADHAVREAVFAIADAGAARNRLVDVSGALMFTRSVFVHLLEGGATDVESTFERICRDMRHRRVVLIDYSETDRRAFPNDGLAAFEGDERVRGLFPKQTDSAGYTRSEGLSANAAVEVMQSLHAKRIGIMRRSTRERLTATDVMG